MYFSTDKKLIIMYPKECPFDAEGAVRIFRRCGMTAFHDYMGKQGFDEDQRCQLANMLLSKRPKCFERAARRDYSEEIMKKIHSIWAAVKNPTRRENRILIAILES